MSSSPSILDLKRSVSQAAEAFVAQDRAITQVPLSDLGVITGDESYKSTFKQWKTLQDKALGEARVVLGKLRDMKTSAKEAEQTQIGLAEREITQIQTDCDASQGKDYIKLFFNLQILFKKIKTKFGTFSKLAQKFQQSSTGREELKTAFIQMLGEYAPLKADIDKAKTDIAAYVLKYKGKGISPSFFKDIDSNLKSWCKDNFEATLTDCKNQFFSKAEITHWRKSMDKASIGILDLIEKGEKGVDLEDDDEQDGSSVDDKGGLDLGDGDDFPDFPSRGKASSPAPTPNPKREEPKKDLDPKALEALFGESFKEYQGICEKAKKEIDTFVNKQMNVVFGDATAEKMSKGKVSEAALNKVFQIKGMLEEIIAGHVKKLDKWLKHENATVKKEAEKQKAAWEKAAQQIDVASLLSDAPAKNASGRSNSRIFGYDDEEHKDADGMPDFYDDGKPVGRPDDDVPDLVTDTEVDVPFKPDPNEQKPSKPDGKDAHKFERSRPAMSGLPSASAQSGAPAKAVTSSPAKKGSDAPAKTTGAKGDKAPDPEAVRQLSAVIERFNAQVKAFNEGKDKDAKDEAKALAKNIRDVEFKALMKRFAADPVSDTLIAQFVFLNERIRAMESNFKNIATIEIGPKNEELEKFKAKERKFQAELDTLINGSIKLLEEAEAKKATKASIPEATIGQLGSNLDKIKEKVATVNAEFYTELRSENKDVARAAKVAQERWEKQSKDFAQRVTDLSTLSKGRVSPLASPKAEAAEEDPVLQAEFSELQSKIETESREMTAKIKKALKGEAVFSVDSDEVDVSEELKLLNKSYKKAVEGFKGDLDKIQPKTAAYMKRKQELADSLQPDIFQLYYQVVRNEANILARQKRDFTNSGYSTLSPLARSISQQLVTIFSEFSEAYLEHFKEFLAKEGKQAKETGEKNFETVQKNIQELQKELAQVPEGMLPALRNASGNCWANVMFLLFFMEYKDKIIQKAEERRKAVVDLIPAAVARKEALQKTLASQKAEKESFEKTVQSTPEVAPLLLDAKAAFEKTEKAFKEAEKELQKLKAQEEAFGPLPDLLRQYAKDIEEGRIVSHVSSQEIRTWFRKVLGSGMISADSRRHEDPDVAITHVLGLLDEPLAYEQERTTTEKITFTQIKEALIILNLINADGKPLSFSDSLKLHFDNISDDKSQIKLKLRSLPEQFMIQGKRFVQEGPASDLTLRKENGSFLVPLSFGFRPEYLENGKKMLRQFYECTAIIVHKGGLKGGHYLFYFKGKDGWYLMNDEKEVRRITSEELDEVREKAYFYHFRKKEFDPAAEHPASILTQEEFEFGCEQVISRNFDAVHPGSL